MLIVFGWGHQKTKILGPALLRECENCHNYDAWLLFDASTWFTFFFVPIFPYRVRHFLLCPICNRGVELTREQFRTMRESPLLTFPAGPDREVLKQALIMGHEGARTLPASPEGQGLLQDPIVGTWTLHSVSRARTGQRKRDLMQLGLGGIYQFDGQGEWSRNYTTPAGSANDSGTWRNSGGGEYVLNNQ